MNNSLTYICNIQVLALLYLYAFFLLIYIHVIVDQEIWLKDVATTDLNFDVTPRETMTISCTDGTTTITRDYAVNITDEVDIYGFISILIDRGHLNKML